LQCGSPPARRRRDGPDPPGFPADDPHTIARANDPLPLRRIDRGCIATTSDASLPWTIPVVGYLVDLAIGLVCLTGAVALLARDRLEPTRGTVERSATHLRTQRQYGFCYRSTHLTAPSRRTVRFAVALLIGVGLVRLIFIGANLFLGHVARIIMERSRFLLTRLLLIWVFVVGHGCSFAARLAASAFFNCGNSSFPPVWCGKTFPARCSFPLIVDCGSRRRCALTADKRKTM